MAYFDAPMPAAIDMLADARHQSGPGLKPKIIILHATGGTDSREWLSTHPKSNVSIHRLVMKDGTAYRHVPDTNIAHHVGYGDIGDDMNINDVALGVEFENQNNGKDPYPEAQMRAAAAIVVAWWATYGFLPVVSHALVDTQGKNDPAGFNWTRWNELLVERLAACLKPASATSAPAIPTSVAARLVAEYAAGRQRLADEAAALDALGISH